MVEGVASTGVSGEGAPTARGAAHSLTSLALRKGLRWSQCVVSDGDFSGVPPSHLAGS